MTETSRSWFVFRNGKTEGPLTFSALKSAIDRGVFSWVDFGCCPGVSKKWERLCAVNELALYLPPHPAIEMPVATPPSLASPTGIPPSSAKPTVVENSPWFIQYQGSEFGPMTLAEIKLVLGSRRLQGDVFCWQQGLDRWIRPEESSKLSALLTDAKVISGGPAQADRRLSYRGSLVATVHFQALEQKGMAKRMTGICRDISETGVLIHSAARAGEVGAKLALRIEPIALTGISPIEAVAELVRYLPDGQGFSAKFQGLAETARRELSRYLEQQKKRP